MFRFSQFKRSVFSTNIKNWNSRRIAFLDVIRKSEFVAIDLEFTGLHVKQDRFLGIEKCYEAHVEGANTFTPVQFGICAARRSETDNNEWILTPASIYVFPRKENALVSASTNTLTFLRENGFDFNEWISHGVSWISPSDEGTRRASIASRRKELEHMKHTAAQNKTTNVDSGLQPTDDLDRALVEALRSEIKAWLTSGARDVLNFPVESAFQRLLLHSVVHREFPLLFSHSTRQGDTRFLSIYASQSEVFDAQLRTLDQEEELLDTQLGVRSLLDAISKEKKILVGHNCFYDIMHIQQSFYESLPPLVSDFKRMWSSRFPAVLDTKHLAESHETLTPLDPPATLRALSEYMANHKFLKDNAFIKMKNTKVSASATNVASTSISDSRISFKVEAVEDSGWTLPSFLYDEANVSREIIDAAKRTEVDMSHEAGYDALLTASLLILQLDRIIAAKQLSWENISFDVDGKNIYRLPLEENSNSAMISTKSSSLKKLSDSMESKSLVPLTSVIPSSVNRVRLVRTQPPILNLSGKDESVPSRLFLMQNFPSTWRKWEIMKVWSPVWVSLHWVKPGVCWIVAPSDEAANQMKILYEGMDQKFKLLSYEEFKNDKALSAEIEPPNLGNAI